MKLTGEQKQKLRRLCRKAILIIFFIFITIAECIIVGVLVSIGKVPGIYELIMYQITIPIILGFNIIQLLMGTKMKPDLYDEYAITSLTTIKDHACKFVELHNQFAIERGSTERLEIIKKGSEK